MPENQSGDELKSLDSEIAAAKARNNPAAPNPVASVQRDAMRLAIELVSGVLVGGFVGYWLDSWLETKPVFLITFFFLGVAAGAWNIYKLSAKSPQAVKKDLKSGR